MLVLTIDLNTQIALIILNQINDNTNWHHVGLDISLIMTQIANVNPESAN